MPIEFIGYISNNNSSETIVRQGPVLDPTHIEAFAKAHENAGFDRVLLAFHSTTPDSLQVGQHVLGVTGRLNVLIAQRPGFTSPTLLARQLATIDQFSKGRVALHVITGGNATELRQDGNTIDDKAAWAKAEAILERAAALQDKTGYRKPADGHATAGARRLLALADQGTRIDKRLWTEIAKLTGANSNTTALVGTPEQVAEVFGDYYDLGISHFLIRGFDPLIDAVEYGRELIPLTRKLIAERQAANRLAAE